MCELGNCNGCAYICKALHTDEKDNGVDFLGGLLNWFCKKFNKWLSTTPWKDKTETPPEPVRLRLCFIFNLKSRKNETRK